MPLYEYACKSCDHHFEIRHSAHDTPELTCPKCGGEVQKVFFPSGIIFKGSGWYVTDNAPKKHAPTEEKESKPEATPAATTPKDPSPK